MSDAEYRRLLRGYHAGDVSLAEPLVILGIRNGFTLLQLKEAGLPWELVFKNLHYINPAFMSWEDADTYKALVLQEEGWHPDFVLNEWRSFVPCHPEDTWAPSWPGGYITLSIYFACYDYPSKEGLSDRKIRKLGLDKAPKQWIYPRRDWGAPDTPLGIRLAFWGADDTGVELDMGPEGSPMAFRPQQITTYPECLLIADHLLRTMPNPATKDWMWQNSFEPA